jgi:cytochrome P450
MNIVSPQFKADPSPFLAKLRSTEPVYRTTLPDKTPVWLISRYDDVLALLKDERFVEVFSQAPTADKRAAQQRVVPMIFP